MKVFCSMVLIAHTVSNIRFLSISNSKSLETGLCTVNEEEVENPNGFDPFFNWTVVHANELLEKYNVTYLDLINKPIQVKIVFQARLKNLDFEHLNGQNFSLKRVFTKMGKTGGNWFRCMLTSG